MVAACAGTSLLSGKLDRWCQATSTEGVMLVAPIVLVLMTHSLRCYLLLLDDAFIDDLVQHRHYVLDSCNFFLALTGGHSWWRYVVGNIVAELRSAYLYNRFVQLPVYSCMCTASSCVLFA